MLLNLAIKDVTNFTYVLDVIGEGISSMQSIPMVCCFEAVIFFRDDDYFSLKHCTNTT